MDNITQSIISIDYRHINRATKPDMLLCPALMLYKYFAFKMQISQD